MNDIMESHKLIEVVSLIHFCESVQTVDFNDSIPHAHTCTLMFCCSKVFSGVSMWQFSCTDVLVNICMEILFFITVKLYSGSHKKQSIIKNIYIQLDFCVFCMFYFYYLFISVIFESTKIAVWFFSSSFLDTSKQILR